MAYVTLLGFPGDLAVQLGQVLTADSHVISRKDSARALHSGASQQVVFVCGDAPGFLETVSRFRTEEPGVPVVVATRLPDNKQWLDALEAGASDYCGAPFEPRQVRWVMNTALADFAKRAA